MKTTNKFISEAIEKHNHKYDYSKVVYANSKLKVIITCNAHGDFEQRPNSHLLGRGCPKCSPNKKSNTTDFIERANLVHCSKYDYSKSKYVLSKSKIEIVCKIHGSFFQTPNDHLSGSGCSKCGDYSVSRKLKSNASSFIEKSTIIHKNRYDYSKVEYIGNKSNVIIICPNHGDFLQTPNTHLKGSSCPKCSSKFKSQNIWLDSLNIPDDHYHRQVRIRLISGNTIIADGFDTTTNTIYEYWGTYFHGHPKYYPSNQVCEVSKICFGELYEKTLKKIEEIKDSGYNLVEVWGHKGKSGKIIIVPPP